MKEAVLVSGVRTAIGKFGGSLKDTPSIDLMGMVIKEALNRGKVPGELVGDVIVGQCMQRSDEYVTGRLAALKAGLGIKVPGVTIQRNCASGLQAIVYAAQQIMLGDEECIVAGGVEIMSRVPYILYDARWGKRMQHGVMTDGLTEGLSDAWSGLIMGLTAENVAAKWGVTREQQDEVALRSHHNAEAAINAGKFKDEVMPVPIPGKKKGEVTMFTTEEHVRLGMKMEDLTKLKPAFKKDGTVTAGNASGINDAAAAVVMMSADKAKELGLPAIAKLKGYACAGVEPELMGYGPVPAVQKLMQKTGRKLDDVNVIECNEAFAAQYVACEKLLGMKRERVNVNGSGIALGHPVGATGARITITLINELKRRGGGLGITTMCVGGGMGMAALWEV
jgi:acetyl-CoA C-acetyltransferase